MMKLYFEQYDKNPKNCHPLEFGDVNDSLIGRLLVMQAKMILDEKKKFTMQSLLDSLQDPGDSALIKNEWTNDLRKPKDVLFIGMYISRVYGAAVVQWDLTDQFKERMKKRSERLDKKLKEELEAIQSKKKGRK